MVVYFKKKEYLSNYYQELLRKNNIVFFFHISDLLVLKALRQGIKGLVVQLFKNNMADNVFKPFGLRGIFLSNTIAVIANTMDFAKLDSKKLVLVVAKVHNYVIFPSSVKDLQKFNFNRDLILMTTFAKMQSVNFILLEFFTKLIYINLIKICQR